MHYNPFAYIQKEEDIEMFAKTLINNTKDPTASGGDPFWIQAETLLYVSLISYIIKEAPEEERNMGMLMDMLEACETREDDEDFKNAIDLIFEELEEENPDHFAVLQYRKLKLSAGKTMKSILISCATRLAPFDIKELREITTYDEMDIENL